MRFPYYFLALLLFVSSCLAGEADPLHLWITQSFGSQKLSIQEISPLPEARNTIAVLQSATKVKTSSRDTFIESIQGVASTDSAFWFFYVNGTLAPVGGASYIPRPGDVIWWDHHPWKEEGDLSAFIGAFPDPFLHGYDGKPRPTVILHTSTQNKQAGTLLKKLASSGVQNLSQAPFDKKTPIEYSKQYHLVLGDWPSLAKHALIQGMAEHFKKTGFPAKFDSKGMHLLDASGVPQKTLRSGSLIVAIKTGTGKDCPTWIVTGTDDAAVSKAAALLTDAPDKIHLLAAAALDGDRVIALPIQKKTDEAPDS